MKKQDPAPLALCRFTASRVCYSVKPASGPACPSVCRSGTDRATCCALRVGGHGDTLATDGARCARRDTKKQMLPRHLVRFASDSWDFRLTLSSSRLVSGRCPAGLMKKVVGSDKWPPSTVEGLVHELRPACEGGIAEVRARLHLFASAKCTWEPTEHRRKNTLAQGDASEDGGILRRRPFVTKLKYGKLPSELRGWGRCSPPPHHHHPLQLLMERVSAC